MSSSLSFKYVPPVDTGLDILYQDDHLLFVNKPAGLLSVPGRDADKQDCLIQRVQREYPAARIVHRLDMATSGAMVLALDDEIHRQLSMLFEKRQVAKKYVAVVHGLMTEQQGLVDLPLRTDWPNRPKQMIDYEYGKSSQTRFSVITYDHEQLTTRVELVPLTGRTHQLRVHLQSLGHAILGDRLYAGSDSWEKSSRLLLHSSSLSFQHPVSGEPVVIHSLVPF